jgi:hypothetical protein
VWELEVIGSCEAFLTYTLRLSVRIRVMFPDTRGLMRAKGAGALHSGPFYQLVGSQSITIKILGP